MSYRDWHVGMKVVCVDATYSSVRLIPLGLREGAVYTIREIGALLDDGKIGVRLQEVEFPAWPDGTEGAVHPKRFRPLQKRNTDIEIFKRLLTDPHVKISEDA